MCSDLMALQEKLDDELLSQDKSSKLWSISFPVSLFLGRREISWDQGCLMVASVPVENQYSSYTVLVVFRLETPF